MCRVALLASLISIKSAHHINIVIRSIEGKILTIWRSSRKMINKCCIKLDEEAIYTNMDASNRLVTN